MPRWVRLATTIVVLMSSARAAHAQNGARCVAARAATASLAASVAASAGGSSINAAETAANAARTNGQSDAASFDGVAAGAFITGDMKTAAWASLQAAQRGWTARRSTNAGVALMSLKRVDDAAPFIACGVEMDPSSPRSIEAQAMLAYRRHDCAAATSSIDRAAALDPMDMNVHYTAGVVHYRCGDRGTAAAQLKAASEIAPTDPVVTRALGVAAPGASPDPVQMPKAVRRQVDELVRFMDQAIVVADRSKERQIALAQALHGFAYPTTTITSSVDLLHRRVDDHKRMLAQIETASAKVPQFAGTTGVWNGILGYAIRAYFETTHHLYDALNADDAVRQYTVMAEALGMLPGDLVEKMHQQPDGDFVIQDAVGEYKKATRSVNGVAPPCEARLAAYGDLSQTVQQNLKAIVDGFPRAAATVVTTWMRYEAQAADYAHRTAKLMGFPASPTTLRDMQLSALKQAYVSDISKGIGTRLSARLKVDNARVLSMEHDDPIRIEGQRPICGGTPPKAANLADVLDALLNALEKAGEYDAGFESPDCDLEIGAFKLSYKPLANEGVKASWDGPVKVSANTDLERWGVDVTAHPEKAEGESEAPSQSVTEGTNGGRITLSETKIKDTSYGAEASVKVSTWIEGNGQGDVYAEASANFGVGVDAEGVGKVSCEFFGASATINLRAFAEALVN